MRTSCCVLLFSLSAFAGDGDMQTRVFPLKMELIGGHTFVRPDEEPPSFMGLRETLPLFEAVNPDQVGGSAVAMRHSAKAVLLNEGIPFPPGASASFHPQSGLLSVRNTPENLRHAQLFLESFERDLPANQSYLVTVIEAPGETIRQMNAAAVGDLDYGKALATLLTATRQPKTEVSVIADAFFERHPGSRATLDSVLEHVIPSGLTTRTKNGVIVDMEWARSGLKFEVESGFDFKGHSLTLEVSTRLPSQRPLTVSDPARSHSGTFPATSTWQTGLRTTVDCKPGETRLLSVSAPLGAKDKDVLWAMFITVGMQRIPSMPSPCASLMENSESDAPSSGLKQMVFHLPEGFLDFFIAEHAQNNLQTWLECNGLEKVKGAAASQTPDKLMVTNTQENIERVHGILREMRRSLPGVPVLTVNTIRGPAFRVRDLTRAHILRGDHAALWRALQDEVSKGAASYIDSARVTVDSNGGATHHSGRSTSHITDFSTDKDGQASMDFEERKTGSVIGLQAWLPPNDECVSVSLTHELETGPPSSILHTFKHPASGAPFEMSLPVLHMTRTGVSFSIPPGTTRLVSLCRLPGDAGSAELCATFISCEVTRQIPSQRPSATAPGSKDGELAKQTLTQTPSQAQNQKRETRVFQPPAGFFSNAAGGWGPVPDDLVKEVLKQSGVDLPGDATAQISGNSGILRITATSANLDQIEALFKKTKNHLDQNLILTAHVFEGPGPFIREVVRNMRHGSDDSALLISLQNGTRIGKVKYATTMRVETKSGVRAQTEQARQVQQLMGLKPSGDGGTEFLMEMRKSGYLFEVEPTLHPDDNGIKLVFSIECSPADPAERLEHLTDSSGKKLEFPLSDLSCAQLTSTITLNPETTKLAWVSRAPDATEDRLYAMFLNYTIGSESPSQ